MKNEVLWILLVVGLPAASWVFYELGRKRHRDWFDEAITGAYEKGRLSGLTRVGVMRGSVIIDGLDAEGVEFLVHTVSRSYGGKEWTASLVDRASFEEAHRYVP